MSSEFSSAVNNRRGSLSLSLSRRSSLRSSDLISSELKKSVLSSPYPKNRTTEELTINKLRISSLGLYGREAETAALQTCLDRLTTTDNNEATSQGPRRKELVWIRGQSGTGKSALCHSLGPKVKKIKGAFVSGKFDLYLRDEPYSGIADACKELCNRVLERQLVEENGLVEDIRKQLETQLGHEISVLVDVIPSVKKLLGGKFQKRSSDPYMQQNPEAKSQQINYVFRIFMRVMTSCFAVLVLALDDLQWADMASIELIETLMTDSQNSQIMIVGCYRTNEVHADHALSKIISTLGENEDSGCRTTQLTLGNLGVDESHEVVMALLSIEDKERTLRLAQICHKKTLGNPFFLIQYLLNLTEEGFLEFDLGTFQWNWEDSGIEEKTTAADNVVELVKERMEKLPKQHLHFLKLAACIGSTFSQKMMSIAWENVPCQSDGEEEAKETLDSLVEMAIQGNFIEGSVTFQWLHDKIQEAAMQLIAHKDSSEIKFEIGLSLYRELSPVDLAAEIFVVANLLNSVEQPNMEKQRSIVFGLNLEAAEKAKSFSAFESAAMYANRAIGMLPPACWDRHFDQTLRLYSVGAEACGYLGHTEEMKAHCDEVLGQKKCTIFDKLRVYRVLLDSYGNCGRKHDAVDLGLSVLRQLGCKFPRIPAVQTLSSFSAILSLRRNPPKAENIRKLSVMTDRSKKECIKLLFQLQAYLYYTKNWSIFILGNARVVKWTMEYGLSEFCSTGFSGIGIIVPTLLGDFKAGTAFADAAVLITELLKDGSKRLGCESRECFSVACISSWTRPIPNVMKSLPGGYKLGMQVGDTERFVFTSNVNNFGMSQLLTVPFLHHVQCHVVCLKPCIHAASGWSPPI